jgi:hypothetical protein
VATVNRDISYSRQQAKHNIRKYIDERLSEEYEKCLTGLTSILSEAGLQDNKQMKAKKRYRNYHWLKNAILSNLIC